MQKEDFDIGTVDVCTQEFNRKNPQLDSADQVRGVERGLVSPAFVFIEKVFECVIAESFQRAQWRVLI